MKNIFILELNEVPEFVFERYCNSSLFPNVQRLWSKSQKFKTVVNEIGELSPWVTWPSFHRGLAFSQHGIKNLNQDPKTFRGTPIWEEYTKAGHAIGIMGPLQSWPPHNPGRNGFYVPDTFASDASCFPEWLTPIQELNLKLVSENGRTMNKISLAKNLGFSLLLSLLRSKVRFRTFLEVVKQVTLEAFDSRYRERRVTYQAMIFWDIFRGLYKASPGLCYYSFFTNHIASVMHRYWRHIFVEGDSFHTGTMDKAWKVVDSILGDIFAWQEKSEDMVLIVATCMGQAMIERKNHLGKELLLTDLDKFMNRIGIASYEPKLAMAPQVAVQFESAAESLEFSSKVSRIEPTGFLNCDMKGNSATVTVNSKCDLDSFCVEGKNVPLSDLGFKWVTTEPGTAYHIPEGEFLVYHSKKIDSFPEGKIPITQVKELILSLSKT